MPCRIRTANDEEALVDAIAEAVWESFASRDPADHRPWAEAGDQWHEAYRRHARAMITVARAGSPAEIERGDHHAERAI